MEGKSTSSREGLIEGRRQTSESYIVNEEEDTMTSTHNTEVCRVCKNEH